MVVTLVIVFAIVGLSFRSLVVPFRAVITIMFTLVIVFGASVLVYRCATSEHRQPLVLPYYYQVAGSTLVQSCDLMCCYSCRALLRMSPFFFLNFSYICPEPVLAK